MEVKPGYKQTEVGVIPEEWEVQALARAVDPMRITVGIASADPVLQSATACPMS